MVKAISFRVVNGKKVMFRIKVLYRRKYLATDSVTLIRHFSF